MDCVEEIAPELLTVKNEQCIIVKTRENKLVITNSVSVQVYVNLVFSFV